jgi:ribosomal protein L7/L12
LKPDTYYGAIDNLFVEIDTSDNILSVVLERKKHGDYEILTVCKYAKISRVEDIEPTGYVVKTADGINSHGETVEAAIKDLRYKIGNRDTTAYEYLRTEKGKVKTDDLIKAYRVITGACMFGTKSFVEGLGDMVKDEYTMIEAISLLQSKNAYGIDKFIDFLGGAK